MNQRQIFRSKNQVQFELKYLLFNQLISWFSKHSMDFNKFQKLSLVGPRRNQMESLLCLEENSKKKRVLKSFGNLLNNQNIELIAYELIVPLIVDHPSILQNISVFVNNKVRTISS